MDVKITSGKSFFWILLFSCFCFMSFLAGCGASRSTVAQDEETVNIDDLLGDDQQNSAQEDADEAEVLRLLGIDQDRQQQATTVEATVPVDPAINDLERDLDVLKEDLQERDEQISELRSELTEKEVKISDLQSHLEAQKESMSKPAPAFRSNATEPTSWYTSNYQEAMRQYKRKNYQAAIRTFGELIQSDLNNSLSDNCQYWIGESYFGLVNYEQAIVEFEKVFSFANSNKSDDAQLKLGICHLKLGNRQQATAEFNTLLSSYPDSEYRALAQRYLSR